MAERRAFHQEVDEIRHDIVRLAALVTECIPRGTEVLLAMDLQGAGTPETYSLEAFRIAFLTQVPLWALGTAFIIFERKRTRVHIGLDEPRTRRRDRGQA